MQFIFRSNNCSENLWHMNCMKPQQVGEETWNPLNPPANLLEMILMKLLTRLILLGGVYTEKAHENNQSAICCLNTEVWSEPLRPLVDSSGTTGRGHFI